MKLLVNAAEFCEKLVGDLRRAKHSFYVQTLSFEADGGGKFLSDLFYKFSNLDRRLIIDKYTQCIMNDKFIYHPKNLFDKNLQSEVKFTRALVNEMIENKVLVKWVNPLGLFWRKLSARNHKKIITVDNSIAYVGGINFSDHNFAWHDLMVRFSEDEGDTQIVNVLREDYLKSWDGINQGFHKSFGKEEVFFLDGKKSPEICQGVFQIIRNAKKSIFVQSPYLSSPFYEELGEAAARGVQVNVVVPGQNNWGLYDQYTEWEIKKNKLNLYKYKEGMSHLKCIVVDRELVVIGSSNFDYFSYHLHQELMVVIRNEEFVKDFCTRIVDADLSNSEFKMAQISEESGLKIENKMKNLFRLMYRLNQF